MIPAISVWLTDNVVPNGHQRDHREHLVRPEPSQQWCAEMAERSLKQIYETVLPLRYTILRPSFSTFAHGTRVPDNQFLQLQTRC